MNDHCHGVARFGRVACAEIGRLRPLRSAILAATILIAASLSAAASEPHAVSTPGTIDTSETGTFWERPRLTGTWGGVRSTLADRGVELEARYSAGSWSNVDGGRRDGTRYEGFAQWAIETDLDRLVGWHGGRLVVNGYSYHGAQPTDSLVGGFGTLTVSGNETSDSFRFFEIFLSQTWSEERFAIKAGQLAADSDFFISAMADTLLNGTFGFLGLGRDKNLAPFFPLATPGAYLRARTRDADWEVRAGVYSADTGEDDSNNIGFDDGFSSGAFAIAEIRHRHELFGRSGSTLLGAAVTTARIEDYGKGGKVRGGYGLYGLVDQILIEGAPDRPELGLFARFYAAPQQDRSIGEWYLDGGFELTRPLPGRPGDVFSMGFAYLHFADDYRDRQRANGDDVTQSQSVLEITYRAQLTGWLTLQPDLQLIFDPHFSRRDATVIGIRAMIEL